MGEKKTDVYSFINPVPIAKRTTFKKWYAFNHEKDILFFS